MPLAPPGSRTRAGQQKKRLKDTRRLWAAQRSACAFSHPDSTVGSGFGPDRAARVVASGPRAPRAQVRFSDRPNSWDRELPPVRNCPPKRTHLALKVLDVCGCYRCYTVDRIRSQQRVARLVKVDGTESGSRNPLEGSGRYCVRKYTPDAQPEDRHPELGEASALGCHLPHR
jgi:hypothetical protein